jgi:CubicO group peptidase (beta-lactamase class C family)
MLLGGGGDILTRASVALMISDHLTPAQKAASVFIPGFWDGCGWGFCLGVTTDPAAAIPRGYGWDGGLGTSWRNDPDLGLIGILLTQRPMTAPKMTETATDFWRLAYAAVDGSRQSGFGRAGADPL